MIGGYLNQIAQVRREAAAVFYDGPAASSLELEEITVSIDFGVKVALSGGERTGTVTITGQLDGSPVSETITFSGASKKYSSNTYDALTSITTSGLADEDPAPNITIAAVDALLHDVMTTTWEDFDCRWEEKAVPYWNSLGLLVLSDAKVICEETIEAGATIRKSANNQAHEVKSMKPAVELEGAEEFRTLLL